jgi:hypothetical protein
VRARLLLVPLLTVAVVLELGYLERDRSRPESGLDQSRRALTLLDFWSQSAVPSVLADRSRRRALAHGDGPTAALLERQVRRGVLRLRSFSAMAARDPALRQPGAPEVKAVRAAGAAWTALARALLAAPSSARRLDGLEATAMRLHQHAYDVVDASLLVRTRAR